MILACMIMALAQFQQEESSILPDEIMHNFNEDWHMVSLDGTETAKIKPENYGKFQKELTAAFEDGNYQITDLPYTEKKETSDIIAFHSLLPPECAGRTVNVSSADAKVLVFLDGNIIYQYGFSGEDISGNSQHLLDIPNVLETGEIWISLLPSGANAAPALKNVTFKAPATVVIGVFGNDIIDIGCCLLIIIMAIIMLMLALIRKYANHPSRGELFLGLAEISAGTYFFIGTGTLDLFYNIQAPYAAQEYLVLIIPLLLTLYFEQNLYTTFPRRFYILLWLVNANGLLQTLLHLFSIRSLQDMELITSIIAGLICVTAIASLLQSSQKNNYHHTIPSVLALLILLAGDISTVITHTFHCDIMDYQINQYSMVLFGIITAAVHIFQLSKEYRESVEKNAKLLEEKVHMTEQQNIQLTLAKKDADAARQEALAANDAKGKFLAHMSHEIRTPINAVLGMDAMILRESKEPNIKEYAMDIYTAGQTLLSLINDILDFSKIESGKMEIVPVEYDISSLIHDLGNMASLRAQDKNLSLKIEAGQEIPSRLYGDDVRIRQVLTNLLTNAIKYTLEGTVWLRVQSRKKDDAALLHFEVEDTGIGIKEEDMPKLCAEFERIEEERNRNIEGTGLGMSITIQLLSLLGSKLQVESTYGKGSKFYFELEQKVIDPTPIGDLESKVQNIAENYNYNTKFCAPEAKILVVDDNAVNRKVLRSLLKETLLQLTEASSGKECLQLIQENHYDLIFLDHMMPEMDGLKTLHHIKELSDFPCQGTPIIVLTANAISGAKEKYLSEGFDDFLSKPIVPEKLEAMIQKMLPEELLSKTATNFLTATTQTGTGIPEDFLEGLPPVDGLDWRYAWIHLPDQELLTYTVKEFYAQIDSAANQLEQAYEKITEPEHLTQYRIQVHAMKSLAATVGIFPLSGIAKLLEYAAKNGRIDVITSITASFLEEWRSYRQKLQGVFGIGTEEKKEITDPSILKALLEMLRISMQELDVDQADQIMGQLQSYEYPEKMEQNMQKLAEAVTNLDAENTEGLVDILISQADIHPTATP